MCSDLKNLVFLLLIISSGCSNGTIGEEVVQSSQVESFKAKQITDHLFNITIDRKIKGNECTQGYFLINGKPIAYTLELPDKDNEEYVSSIPKGSYDAKIRTDGNLGWRIELLDVPDRENVEIHVGNFTRQIEGCILIGTKVDIKNCNVTNSYKHEAIEKLQSKFNEFTRELILDQGSIEPISIQVDITGI